MPSIILHLPTEAGTTAIQPATDADVRALELYQTALHEYVATGRTTKLRALKQRTVKDTTGTVYVVLGALARLRELAETGALVFDWDFDD